MTTGLRFVGGVAAMLIAASPTLAFGPSGRLKGLEPGEWELRERGEDGAGVRPRRLCLTDLRQLIQIRHSGHNCRRLTVDETTSRIAVSYDCAGAGGGRTDLRIETSRLVQIRSQGVVGGAPFSFMMEGRRIGACR
ncbi:DUF3617 domain-containing protein [Sphingobium mellinum]|uniref:DUF3617 domain-containing protein n=1 Tax=Sphingobium mellinum TaxID=1387166 RepID=UPI0030EE563C